MAKTTSPRLAQTRWSAGTDTFNRTDFDTDASKLDQLVMIYLQGTLAARPAAGIGGRLYTVAGDTTANNNRQFYDNGSSWITLGKFVNTSVVSADAATDVPLTVSGLASQTGNLQQWTNSSGTVLGSVSPTGVATFKENTLGGTTAGSSVALATNKIGQLVNAPSGQTANLAEWRVNNAAVAILDASGNGTFARLASNSSLSVATTSAFTGAVTMASTLAAADTTITSTSAGVGFTVSNISGIPVQFNGTGGALLSQQQLSGTWYSQRLAIGDPAYSSATGDAARIVNKVAASPTLRLIGAASQSANPLQVETSTGTQLLALSAAGVLSTSSSIYNAGGWYTSAPSNLNGTSSPATVDITTGAGTGTYTDTVVYRHPAQTTTAVNRRIRFAMKLSDESNATEAGKWAGFDALSTLASGASPALQLYAGGARWVTVAGDDGRTHFYNDIYLRNDGDNGVSRLTFANVTSREKIVLYDSGSSQYHMGVQAGTFYHRAPSNSSTSFNWYAGGVHSSTNNDPGTGGSLVMSLSNDPSDLRLTVPALSLTSNRSTSNSSGPPLTIGTTSGSHLSMSGGGINTWTNSSRTNNDTLIFQNGVGGALQLGNSSTAVSIQAKKFSLGGFNIWIDYNAPTNGDGATNGDIWFNIQGDDASTEGAIYQRRKGTWRKFNQS